MDPACHTLIGAALAESGLKQRTRFATVTLLIGANLPDVDALSYVFGSPLGALAFRRGWTHGVLALAALPMVLTALVLVWGRLVGVPAVPQAPPLMARQVLLLSAISILTHPTLDFMNTYGMRWLMPFVNRWYYGDALFILDPWVWLVLGAGILLTRRGSGKGEGGRVNPAVASLILVAGYALLMLFSSAVERSIIVRQLTAGGARPSGVMVAPVPLNPFRRQVVIDDGDRYRFGTVDWLRRPAFRMEARTVAKNDEAPAARAAALTDQGRTFLGWARYPFFVVEASALQLVVYIVDARYTLDPNAGFGAVRVMVPRSLGPAGASKHQRGRAARHSPEVVRARLPSSLR